MTRVAILGSTGSIGRQALSVMEAYPDRFEIVALTAYSQTSLLFEQVRRHRPRMAGLFIKPEKIPQDLSFCTWVFGEACLELAATDPTVDTVLDAVVGFAGMQAVLAAIACGKRILLANKEALVAGGSLVMEAAKRNKVAILPVDSEHSAIFQCMEAAGDNRPECLILTASGGPFRTWTKERMAKARAQDALKHPNWAMGAKITVDSATMVNKALEVIEAHHLFQMPAQEIDVLIHPQSIVHSLVEFKDGAQLAQLGTPDMRLPILYALSYPERLHTATPRLSLAEVGMLTFEKPDLDRFPGLALGYEALHLGGTAGATLSAANEVAVAAFLKDKIPFGRIVPIVTDVLEASHVQSQPSLSDIIHADTEARRIATERLA